MLWPVLDQDTDLGTVVGAVQDIRAFRARRKLWLERQLRSRLKVRLHSLVQRIAKPGSWGAAVGYAIMVGLAQLVVVALVASLITGVGLAAVIVLDALLLGLGVGVAATAINHKHSNAAFMVVVGSLLSSVVAVAAPLTVLTAICAGDSNGGEQCDAVRAADNEGVQATASDIALDLGSRIMRFLLTSPFVWIAVLVCAGIYVISAATFLALHGCGGSRCCGRLVQSGAGGRSHTMDSEGMSLNPLVLAGHGIPGGRGRVAAASGLHPQKGPNSRDPEAAEGITAPRQSQRSLHSLAPRSECTDEDLASTIEKLHAQIDLRAAAPPRPDGLEPKARRRVTRDKEAKLLLEGLLQIQAARKEDELQSLVDDIQADGPAGELEEATSGHESFDWPESVIDDLLDAERTILRRAQEAISEPTDAGSGGQCRSASVRMSDHSLDAGRSPAWSGSSAAPPVRAAGGRRPRMSATASAAKVAMRAQAGMRSRRSLIALGGMQLLSQRISDGRSAHEPMGGPRRAGLSASAATASSGQTSAGSQSRTRRASAPLAAQSPRASKAGQQLELPDMRNARNRLAGGGWHQALPEAVDEDAEAEAEPGTPFAESTTSDQSLASSRAGSMALPAAVAGSAAAARSDGTPQPQGMMHITSWAGQSEADDDSTTARGSSEDSETAGSVV